MYNIIDNIRKKEMDDAQTAQALFLQVENARKSMVLFKHNLMKNCALTSAEAQRFIDNLEKASTIEEHFDFERCGYCKCGCNKCQAKKGVESQDRC